jgi:hypothetical protein
MFGALVDRVTVTDSIAIYPVATVLTQIADRTQAYARAGKALATLRAYVVCL